MAFANGMVFGRSMFGRTTGADAQYAESAPWPRWMRMVLALWAAIGLTLICPQASAAATVRNVIEFRIHESSRQFVGEWQRGRNPVWQTGEYLINDRVVGTWDITQAATATTPFRTELMVPPGTDIKISVNLPKTGYGPMGHVVKSKDADTLWLVDWFVDSINIAGSQPLTPATAAVPPPAPGEPDGSIEGIEPAGPLTPVNFDLGRRWIVREHSAQQGIWEGTWVRRGNSAVFDATWRLAGGGGEARDVVEVRGMRGNIVEIYRQGLQANYQGAMTGQRTISRGTADWYNSADWWEARIERGDADADPVHPPAPSSDARPDCPSNMLPCGPECYNPQTMQCFHGLSLTDYPPRGSIVCAKMEEPCGGGCYHINYAVCYRELNRQRYPTGSIACTKPMIPCKGDCALPEACR